MQEQFTEASIQIDNMERIMNLFGNFDQNLKVIEDEFNIDIIVREGEVKIVGQENAVAMAERTLNTLMKMQENGEAVT
ncbi:MAG: phosphate starvation-inducible protein PhoH, partial [Clostridiaceae bacterium]|nr:phosphate starvation-inducible protein PhoH [Clostridiaceae bacterium]